MPGFFCGRSLGKPSFGRLNGGNIVNRFEQRQRDLQKESILTEGHCEGAERHNI